jgi:hypothetical protein
MLQPTPSTKHSKINYNVPDNVLSAFILNEKHKIAQAKLVKKHQLQKEKELKMNMLTISPQQLMTLQSEIQQLSEEYDRQANLCCGVKTDSSLPPPR